MSQTPEWVGYFLLFFTVFCIVALPTAIIIYIYNLWKNKRDLERPIKIQNKKLSGFDRIIRSTAGILMIILGCILFIWPFYRIFILKDIPYGVSIKGVIALLSDLVFYFGLPITLITLGRFYFLSGKVGDNNVNNKVSL